MALLCPVIVVFKIIAAVCQLLNNEGHSVTRVGKSEMISNISCFCKQKLAPAGRNVFKVKKPRNYKSVFYIAIRAHEISRNMATKQHRGILYSEKNID